MRKIEIKMCSKCKGMYRWERGGVIMTLQDYIDKGLCEKCRTKLRGKNVENTLGDIKIKS